MTTPHANPPAAQPTKPKRKGMSPAMKVILGFIAAFIILPPLSDIGFAAKSAGILWVVFLVWALLIAIPAGLFFRPIRPFAIGALSFIGVALLVFFSLWAFARR